MATNKSVLSFKDWKTLFMATFKAFPEIWWRILVVNLCTLAVLLLGGGVIAGLGILLFGGFQEGVNVILNLTMTGNATIYNIWIFGLLLFILINWFIVFGVIGKIANFLVVKDYTKRKASNPLVLYFQDSWKYFWRYVMVGLRTFVYILVPMVLLFVSGVFVSFMFLPAFKDSANNIVLIFGILTVIALIVFALYLLIRRSISVIFAQAQLIEQDKTSKEAFDGSLFLANKNWGSIFGAFLLFIIIVGFIPGVLLGIVSNFHPEPLFVFGSAPNILPLMLEDVLSNIYSYLLVVPASIAFLYFLMLHIAKKKKLK